MLIFCNSMAHSIMRNYSLNMYSLPVAMFCEIVRESSVIQSDIDQK